MPVPRISKEDLKARLEGDAASVPVLLDARLKYPYEHSSVRLPGAARINPDHPDFASLPAGRDVVVYDSDPNELVAAPIVAGLISRGVTARALKGGIAEWMGANLPTEPKNGPLPGAPPVEPSTR
jgi:rhodanese-related sulfurtransferase